MTSKRKWPRYPKYPNKRTICFWSRLRNTDRLGWWEIKDRLSWVKIRSGLRLLSALNCQVTFTDLAKSSRENKFKDKRSPRGLSYVLKKLFLQREFFCDATVICKCFFWSVVDQKWARYRSGWGCGGYRERTASRPPRSNAIIFWSNKRSLKDVSYFCGIYIYVI